MPRVVNEEGFKYLLYRMNITNFNHILNMAKMTIVHNIHEHGDFVCEELEHFPPEFVRRAMAQLQRMNHYQYRDEYIATLINFTFRDIEKRRFDSFRRLWRWLTT